MKLRKILALVMATTLLATVVTGCGGSGDKDKNGDESNKTEATGWEAMFGEEYVKARADYEAEHNPYDIPEELKGTTVKIATWIDHTTTEAAWIMENFEKDTGIKVEWVQIPQGTYFQQLSQMVAAGNAPDIYVENNEFFPMTLQISKPLDEVSSIDLNDPIWDTGYAEFTTFGDHYYQLNAKNSVWQTTNLVYYNKKAMEDNGLLTPQDYIDAGEWTWDNMLNIMREYDQLGDRYSGGQLPPETLATTLGTSIMYMKDGKFVSGLNDAGLATAYKTYLQTLDEGIYNANAATNMIKGTVGLYITDSYGLKQTGYFKGIDEDVLGFAPIPEKEGEENYTSSHYRAYGILSGSKNPEAAGYFLRYFLDPYNYDWDNTFVSEDARDYYLEYIAGQDFSEKVFSFDLCGALLLGYASGDEMRIWRYALMRTSSDQLTTVMQSISGEVDSAIKKANAILDEISAK
jgi:ABC-type glycerol-3-phosphate transport system substrate-binding protein